MGIGLDPYPRKPGLSLLQAGYGEDDKPENPFIRLAEQQKKTGKPDKDKA